MKDPPDSDLQSMTNSPRSENCHQHLSRPASCLACFLAVLLGPAGNGHGDVTDFAFGDPEVVLLPKGTAPSCIALADLDGDGDLDGVLSGRNLDGRVVLLEGGPNGTLSVSGELIAPGQTDWAEREDFNNDGYIDLVLAVRDRAGSIALFYGTPGGGFEEKPRTIKAGREIRCLQVADIDGNGTLDLILLGHITEDVMVMLGDGAGGFETVHHLRLAPWKNGFVFPQSVTVLDLDDDGLLDVASVSIGARSLHLIKGDGTGALQRARAWQSPLVNNEAGGCAYASAEDFDGDGLFEFLLPQTTWGQQFFVLFELDDEGNVSESRAIQASQWGISWVPEAADFDMDGDIDISIGHALPGVVVFMENVGEPDGPATFLDPQWFFAGEFIRNMKAVDLDNDGDQDLLALDYTGDAVLIFRNGHADGFTSREQSRAPHATNVPRYVRNLEGTELARWLAEIDADDLRALTRGPKEGGKP